MGHKRVETPVRDQFRCTSYLAAGGNQEQVVGFSSLQYLVLLRLAQKIFRKTRTGWHSECSMLLPTTQISINQQDSRTRFQGKHTAQVQRDKGLAFSR